jgi:hypothetical protein
VTARALAVGRARDASPQVSTLDVLRATAQALAFQTRSRPVDLIDEHEEERLRAAISRCSARGVREGVVALLRQLIGRGSRSTATGPVRGARASDASPTARRPRGA